MLINSEDIIHVCHKGIQYVHFIFASNLFKTKVSYFIQFYISGLFS